MIETSTEAGQLESWRTPQCPFAIEYSRRMLDDIRLAVVDAFFSLPRGGAEIGGILLGKFDGQRLLILDYRPLDCEHALGPSFNLSPKDEARLGDLLAANRSNPAGLQPVGWYHSHTRTEIFLSDADLEIHNRYFPDMWQVALVLRPSTFHPTRGGFFFREPDGSISAKASYLEFALDPLPVQPLPSTLVQAPRPRRIEPVPAGPVIRVTPESVPHIPTPPPVPAQAASNGAVPAQTFAAETPVTSAPEPASEMDAEAIPSAAPAVQYLPRIEAIAPQSETIAAKDEIREEGAATPEIVPVSLVAAAAASDEHPAFVTPLREPERPVFHNEPPRERITETRETDIPFPGVLAAERRRTRRKIAIGAAVAAALLLLIVFISQKRPAATSARTPVSKSRKTPVAAASQAPVIPASTKPPARVTATNLPAPPSHAGQAAREEAPIRRDYADLGKQITDMGKENATLGKENTVLSKQNGELRKQNAELSGQQNELRRERDDLAKQTAKLKADLNAQIAHAKQLQQQVDDLRKQQQKKRMSVQNNFDPLE